VIDEIYRVLRYVNSTRAPQRAHEVLQELRDISSMAMEYFDEKIVPILKKRLPGADLSGRLMGSAPGNGHELERVRKAKGRTTTLMLYLSGGIRGGRLEEGRGGGQGRALLVGVCLLGGLGCIC
jgi:hypothetical protein